MLRSCTVALVLALSLPPMASAQERPRPPSAAAVVEMLSGFENGPSGNDWALIGPEVLPVLGEIASDASRPVFLRTRALHAAGNFATNASRTLLRRALSDGEPLLVRAAALALGRAFGESALGDVAPLLAHDDSAVREAAIRIVGELTVNRPGSTAQGRAQARAHLSRRLELERDEALRERIEQALTGERGSSRG